jgi:hypothetical protein
MHRCRTCGDILALIVEIGALWTPKGIQVLNPLNVLMQLSFMSAISFGHSTTARSSLRCNQYRLAFLARMFDLNSVDRL